VIVQGACDLKSKPKPKPVGAVERIVPRYELRPGQCVIYGIGRILTVRAKEDVWIDSIVVAQDLPTQELWGDASAPYSPGTGSFSLGVETGLLYLTRSSVLGRTGVDVQPDAPSLLAAIQIGENVTAAYIAGACPSA
jgi:hypothetical protein